MFGEGGDRKTIMGGKMTIPKALCGWLILLAIAFANGAFRAYYERYLGAHRANQVSCGIGVALFAVAVWIVDRRWPFESSAHAWRTGVLWVLMTVTWELLFFHYVAGRSWKELAGNYAFWEGRLWVLVLLAVLVLPPLADGARRSRVAIGSCLLWGAIAWAACGLVLSVSRICLGMEIALWLYLAAAPVIAYGATVACWNRPRHPRAVSAAALLTGTIFCLDLLIVAPFIERSFVMFESFRGTWAPMGLIAFTSLATGLLLSLPAERRPFLKWMPEDRDLEARMPGDSLLDGESGPTHAITIRCRPGQLWPWLVQMGYGRAGWYSHDRLDNWGHRSSDRLLPEFQRLEGGDRLPSTPDGKCFFEVLDLEPEANLVLGSHLTTGPVHSLRWAETSPSVSQRATWSFALISEAANDTRLRVRTRGVSAPAWRWMPVNAFFSVAHIIMQRKQLISLKRRAETQG